jgi:hypothetical protein
MPHVAKPPQRTPPAPPTAVLAAAVALAIAGGLIIVFALIGTPGGGGLAVELPLAVALSYGLAHLAVAWALRIGLPWARRAALVLCAVGIVLALLRMSASPAAGLAELAWPIIYGALVSTRSARRWFRHTGRDLARR